MSTILYVSPNFMEKTSIGEFKTITEAVQSVPKENKEPITIVIKKGVYEEKLIIDRPYITLVGEGDGESIITYGDYAGKRMENGENYGTFRSYTVFVDTHDFTARNLVFENTAGPVGQALALYADGDRLFFDHCWFHGFQDTIFTGPLPPKEKLQGGFKGPKELSERLNGRQYYYDCYISGNTDFIFGSATAYFDQCEIISRKPGYVTAASTPEGQEYGYVFAGCHLKGQNKYNMEEVCPDRSVYLGRPWRDYAKTVFMNCKMEEHIKLEGWHDWNKPEAHNTMFYAEYQTVREDGELESIDSRVDFSHQLTKEEALHYSKDKVLAGADGWNPIPVYGREQLRERLWYDKPAVEWHEALPVGNGRMGGMVYGDVYKEKIQLNEDSIWYGKPMNRINPDSASNLSEIRKLIFEGKIKEAERLSLFALSGTPAFERIYQTMGYLELSFEYAESKHTYYERELDLEDGIVRTYYQLGDTVFEREVLASYHDQVIAIHLKVKGKEKLNFHCHFNRRKFINNVWHEGSNTIGFEADTGDAAINYSGMLRGACSKDGSIKAIGEFLIIEGASEVVLYLAAATTFRVKEPREECRATLNRVSTMSWEEIMSRHLMDYKELYQRVTLDLGEIKKRELPTDIRLENIKNGLEDNDLMTLYYQYARYLMISCSRPGSLPANLQGIWNEKMDPPWDSKYTININTEMNYWPVETGNLAECHIPLFDHLNRMVVNGSRTAKEMYGCRGFVAHHNTDLYADTAPQDQYIPASYWVMGGAWLSLHVWEHYEHTRDLEFLNSHYNILKEAVLFFHDFLIENEEGQMITCPSVSPENSYIMENGTTGRMCAGPSMDSQILYELFHAFVNASSVLEKSELVEETKVLLEKLPKPQIGKHDQLMEWVKDYDEKDPGHRHISHLFAIYPGSMITKEDTPDLYKAAEKTLTRRLEHGGGHTGWSRAWIILLWSRFYNSEKAYENFIELLKSSTFPNLFDNHPGKNGFVFQIDGNFGAAQGIAEMLVQSHNKRIHLLPALPKAWKDGAVSGLKLRGNIELELSWKDGKLEKAILVPKQDVNVLISYQGKQKELLLTKEEQVIITEKDMYDN